jgi:hypothetical protein
MTTSNTSLDPRSGSAASGSDRRKAPRYSLMAIAELTDPEAAKLVSGNLTQISRNGCYVATPKTFAVGTSLKVIVSRDERTFVARASVIHTQEQMGMGVAFLDPPEDQLKILDSWLAELSPSSAPASNPPR